jgi:hypothetical protein
VATKTRRPNGALVHEAGPALAQDSVRAAGPPGGMSGPGSSQRLRGWGMLGLMTVVSGGSRGGMEEAGEAWPLTRIC